MSVASARTILYADDNPDDFEMFKEAVGECCPDCGVVGVEDGQTLMETLESWDGRGKLKDLGFIVLDMSMPKKDGIEVLYEIKGNPKYRSIPVVMWSGVESERNMLRAYALGCNTFVVKPTSYPSLLFKVQGLIHYWLGLATLPGPAKA